jgi:hypothetical protein
MESPDFTNCGSYQTEEACTGADVIGRQNSGAGAIVRLKMASMPPMFAPGKDHFPLFGSAAGLRTGWYVTDEPARRPAADWLLVILLTMLSKLRDAR